MEYFGIFIVIMFLCFVIYFQHTVEFGSGKRKPGKSKLATNRNSNKNRCQ